MRVDFVDRDDAGMIKLRRSLGFELKSLDVKIRRILARNNHLDCNDPVQFLVACSIDNSHSATSQLFQQNIIAEVFAGRIDTRIWGSEKLGTRRCNRHIGIRRRRRWEQHWGKRWGKRWGSAFCTFWTRLFLSMNCSTFCTGNLCHQYQSSKSGFASPNNQC